MTAPERGKNRVGQRGRLRKVVLAMSIWIILGLTVRFVIDAMAAEPASPEFARTWDRTDAPVKSGLVSRTWLWGDGANGDAVIEPYVDAPGGERTVQYFDKSRIEDNSYRGAPPWDVTNGLLGVELISGRLQLGDATFEQHPPAEVNVAGDPDDTRGPTYQTMAGLLDAPALPNGEPITWRLSRDGTAFAGSGMH